MAEILICGMDKPHNCFCCDLSYLRGERLFCRVTKDEVIRYKIASDCPIIELPEHGDLIERNPLVKLFNSRETDERWGWIDEEDLLNAPVIVPSNKEETNGMAWT